MMSPGHPADQMTTVISSIKEVTSHIDSTCARVGDHLCRGHTAFQDLSEALTALTLDLSGAKTEGASAALQSISRRLNGFAEAVPLESALLGKIRKNVGDSSSLLDVLLDQIKVVAIIARSARIEAASFDAHQVSFLDFTREVFDLAHGIQTTVEACAHDQMRLAKAIEFALHKHSEFQARYGHELRSVSTELVSVYDDIKHRQTQSARLADSTRSGTMRITEAVGNAIVSLQAGDSVRQRLEHVCDALRLVAYSDVSLAPSLKVGVGEIAQASSAIGLLQVEHLKSTTQGFDADIELIRRLLASLSSDAAAMVASGRSLVSDSETDTTSSLSIMRQKLTRASILNSACEAARVSVDHALSVVAEALVKFRGAAAALSDSIVDIILAGMNAGLKAGHLGPQGRAFVVIANELKSTADRISATAALLEPKLDQIATVADDLKRRRIEEQSAQVADHEPSLSQAMAQVDAGNAQLEQITGGMVDAGAQFEALLSDGEALLAALAKKNGTLTGLIDLLLRADGFSEMPPPMDRHGIEAVLDELFASYTMAEERDIHRAFLRSHGLGQGVSMLPETSSADTDDVLFF